MNGYSGQVFTHKNMCLYLKFHAVFSARNQPLAAVESWTDTIPWMFEDFLRNYIVLKYNLSLI